MIKFTEKGSFKRTEKYLDRLKNQATYSILDKYGAMGVTALANATPVESSETANSWYYTIEKWKGYYSIRWHNRNVENGIPIVVLLQYGHGTSSGGFVQGTDYINPAIRPIFERISQEAWEEVTRV